MSTQGHQLPFGLKDGRMVEVSEVVRGRACGCVCPVCLSPLQANKGEQRKYFSHDPTERKGDCENALETAIHKMAKQLLSEHRQMRLPELIIEEKLEGFKGLEAREVVLIESDISFHEVVEEASFSDIRPDILAHIDGEPFFVEIAVTHFVDSSKKKKIRELGIPTIEVDLSKIKRFPTKDELFEKVVTETKGKKWISNPKAKGVRQRLKDKLLNALNKYQSTPLPRIEPSKPKKPVSLQALSPAQPRSIYKKGTRWILCEACRHLFQKTLEEFPLNVPTIECPDCGFHASGALASTGQLPTEM